MVKALFVTVLATFSASAYSATVPNPHYLCSCFQPKYDYGCCNKLKGIWDGADACVLPYTNDAYNSYLSCCNSIGGKETKYENTQGEAVKNDEVRNADAYLTQFTSETINAERYTQYIEARAWVQHICTITTRTPSAILSAKPRKWRHTCHMTWRPAQLNPSAEF